MDMWNKIKNQTNLDNIPKELEKEISNSILFKDNWNKLAPSHKKQYLYWINDAKRNETKLRRIDKVINALNNNEKLGLV